MFVSDAAPRRLAILAEGSLDDNNAKTAAGVIRYSPHRTLAIIDSTHAGRDASEAITVKPGIPVVATLREALTLRPDALLMGTAPRGGALPEGWRAVLREAITARLDILSGLHTFLGDDPELGPLAKRAGVQIHDYRRTPPDLPVGRALCREMEETIVLTVGTDCSVGKMTASIEIGLALQEMGARPGFVATGQTGIMIAGGGYPIDAIAGDFMAGAVEKSVLEWKGKAGIILVEGQGALLHPGYSGVTLALLHGCQPDGLILCHDATIQELKRDYGVPIPSLREVAAQYVEMAKFLHPAMTIGVALRTKGLEEAAAKGAIAEVERDMGLPAADPVRFGARKLAVACVRLRGRKVGR